MTLNNLLSTYRSCAVESARALFRNWVIIPASVFAYFAVSIITGLASQLGLLGGILAGIVGILALSYYYGWLKICSERGKLTASNIGVLEQPIFFDTLNVAFILFLILQTVKIIAHGQIAPLLPISQLTVFLLLNCLPEVIYVQRESNIEALSSAARFTVTNWIEWYLPLLILILPWASRSFDLALVMFSQADPLLPVLLLLQGTMRLAPSGLGVHLVWLLIMVVFANWYMLFRARLFEVLQRKSSNPRAYR